MRFSSFLTRFIGQTDGTSVIQYDCSKRCVLSSCTAVIQLKLCAIAISDAVRTSLGPRGMDKMVRGLGMLRGRHTHPVSFQIQTSKGEVIVTNDGATILKSIQALHPAAKMVNCLYSSIFDWRLLRFLARGFVCCTGY